MSRRKRRPQTTGAHRPDTREIAVAQVTDKYSEYPSNGLTPVRLAEIFKEADAGDVLRTLTSSMISSISFFSVLFA